MIFIAAIFIAAVFIAAIFIAATCPAPGRYPQSGPPHLRYRPRDAGNREESGKTPALAFSSGVCPKWVEDSGCTIRLLASPTFADIEQMIHKYYDTDNPEKEQLREFAFLDSSRHPEYPDDLAVFLLHEDHKPERVWVRGGHLSENEIHGTLLNEPNADFGVHCGDSIPIIPYKQEDESIVCVSPPGK